MKTTRGFGGQRGAAIITVVLILLVLTVLGITAAMLMTQEDRTSARQDHLRAALYVAEAGLRRGEEAIQTLRGDRIGDALVLASSSLQNWHSDPAKPIIHPVQNWHSDPAKPIIHPVWARPATWDVEHLGTYARLTYDTAGAAEMANQEVSLAMDSRAGGPPLRAFFSLYLRNNPEDASGTVTADNDQIVRLVSVGWVANVDGRPLAVKILEEEFDLSAEFVARGTQEGQNQGGTNQAVL
ncbi:MAG: hypothetical protein H6Q02_62 [Acidobacteria bacterium]|nr:hypothetical protein [Acidobacteriota bacterium]